MSLLTIVAASTVALYPVELSDPLLTADDTFVSEHARLLVGENNLGILHCLDTDEMRGFERICLTSDEWQQIFDRIAQNASADQRQSTIGLSQWRANGRTTSLTP